MSELTPHTEDRASKGVGLAVAGVLVAFFAALPFVLAAVLYLFVTVYAIVRAIGPGAGENPVPIVLGFVLITSVLTAAVGITVHFVGRSLTPRKRRAKS